MLLLVILSIQICLSQRIFLNVTKLLASDGLPGDFFGYKVAVSGDTAVVGAYRCDDNGTNSGAAYVYVRSGSKWNQQQKLFASDGSANTYFGGAVAISGDKIIVGANRHNGMGSTAGAAYVFARIGSTWTEEQKLLASDGAAVAHFGTSVAISGNTVIVGSPGSVQQGIESGAVYFYVWTGSIWAETKVVDLNGQSKDDFGTSVSISGDTAIIGAVGSITTYGAVFIYVRSGSTWLQQGQKWIATEYGDKFGSSVSISGDTAIFGAYLHDDSERGQDSGVAYVYIRTGTSWTQQQILFGWDGVSLVNDWFGCGVDITGDTAIVGARHHDFASSSPGAAYIFVRTGSTWNQFQKIIAPDWASGAEFGYTVSITGDTAVVGAWGRDNAGQGGAAYVFFHIRTAAPSLSPTFVPSSSPATSSPSTSPSSSSPTDSPTRMPTRIPTRQPTISPSSSMPTREPTTSPSSSSPTDSPTPIPTRQPTTSKVLRVYFVITFVIAHTNHTVPQVRTSSDVIAAVEMAIFLGVIEHQHQLTRNDVRFWLVAVDSERVLRGRRMLLKAMSSSGMTLSLEVKTHSFSLAELLVVVVPESVGNFQNHLRRLWREDSLTVSTQNVTSISIRNIPTVSPTQSPPPKAPILTGELIFLIAVVGTIVMIVGVGQLYAIVCSCKNSDADAEGSPVTSIETVEYRPIGVIKFGFLTYNTMTDIAFAWSVFSDGRNMVLFIASVVFLVCPFGGSLFAWLQAKRTGLRSHEAFNDWEIAHDSVFLVLSVLCGSSFGAFLLCHSGLFGMDLFNMNLPVEYQLGFLSTRLWFTVVLEDIPQFVIQIMWVVETNGNINVITAAAILGSVISMIVGVYAAVNKKQILVHRLKTAEDTEMTDVAAQAGERDVIRTDC